MKNSPKKRISPDRRRIQSAHNIEVRRFDQPSDNKIGIDEQVVTKFQVPKEEPIKKSFGKKFSGTICINLQIG